MKSIIITVVSILTAVTANAQKLTAEKLLGCWNFVNIEFLQPADDSAVIRNEMKGNTVCFEAGGKFVTKKKAGKDEEILGRGSFRVSEDGKTIYQSRDGANDGGVDDPGQVVLYTGKQIALQIGEFAIVHMERLE